MPLNIKHIEAALEQNRDTWKLHNPWSEQQAIEEITALLEEANLRALEALEEESRFKLLCTLENLEPDVRLEVGRAWEVTQIRARDKERDCLRLNLSKQNPIDGGSL